MAWNVELPDAEWFDLTSHDIDKLVVDVNSAVEIAIDTETSGLDTARDRAYYWSIAFADRRISMPASTFPFFKEAFTDPNKIWIMCNAKFDMHMLQNCGVWLEGTIADVSVMHALLYEEKPHGLKEMTHQILGWTWRSFESTFGKIGKEEGSRPLDLLMEMERKNKSALVEYTANDAYGTLKLYYALLQELEEANTYSLYPDKYPTLLEYFFMLCAPFTKVLYECERNRFKVDTKKLKDLEKPMLDEIASIEKEAWKIAGKPINISSNQQLAKYLFEERGIKTKSGNKSVDKKTLDEIADKDPIVPIVVRHRKLSKILKTYVYGIDKMLINGRVGYRFNQDIARTGRLSSSNINVQNIPRPDSDKFGMRKAFISSENCSLIVIDYEQLEMRLLAAAAMEPDMIAIFLEGKDIHMGNAELVFGPILSDELKREITYKDFIWAKKTEGALKQDKTGDLAKTITPQQLHEIERIMWARQAAKAIGFGLNYGMGANSLASRIGCTVDKAEGLIELYLGRYPAVKHFFQSAVEEAVTYGYAFTVLGRRRYLKELRSLKKSDISRAQRQASNAPIQGSAADVAMCAMLKVEALGLKKKYGCKMLVQVHDELVFECPDEYVDICLPIIKETMEHPFPTDLAVPLTTSAAKGKSWAEAK